MQKQTIALIDDDRNILTSLSIALEKEGFKVQTYIDGESALIGLTRTPPDLAIVDIKMPKMDGEELLKKLRKKTSLPVIFLTSKDDEIDELLGLKLGADDFVKKSGGFSIKVLVEYIPTNGAVNSLITPVVFPKILFLTDIKSPSFTKGFLLEPLFALAEY